MKKKIPFLIIILCSLFSCKKENKTNNQLIGKLKSIKVYTDTNSAGGINNLLLFAYDKNTNKIDSVKYIYDRLDGNGNTIKLYGSYHFLYSSNNILIDEYNITNLNTHLKYKAPISNNYLSQINEVDSITNQEIPIFYVAKSNKLDTVYEENEFPLAYSRACYDYVFDGDNYNNFRFDYTTYNLINSYNIQDSAFITYTNLPFNKFAPMQNMFSDNTLFYLYSGSNIVKDFKFILGFEDYYFYPHNKNLIASIRTVHDTTTIVYFNYEFNSKNQLTKTIVNFREPNSPFLVYDYEYY